MKSYLLALFTLVAMNIYAQEYSITGKLINKLTQTPTEFVNVLLYQNDSIPISGTVTDASGSFKLSAQKGNYILKLEQFGEAFLSKDISLSKDLNLGILSIEPSVALEEIVIEAKKPLIQQKIDRTIFNVENSIAGSNGTALDALRVTPGLQVQNDKISIIGKQEIRVLVNDRIIQFSGEELINYLSSLASDDIKDIEVITSPPAKYDAEGNSGLINIVLKKPKENSWNNQIRTSYIQATYPAIRLGNSFNYNHNKIQFSGSLNAKKGSEQKLMKYQIFYPNGAWKDTITSKEKKDFISARLGLDYKITPKSSIGFLYSGIYRKPNRHEHSNTQIYDLQSQVVGQIENKGFLESSSSNNIFNIHYIYDVDSLGREVSVDLDYFTYNNVRDRLFSSSRTGNIINYQVSKNTSNQSITNYSAKVDMQHPFSWGNLSYGAKLTQTKTDSNVSFFDMTSGELVLDSNQTDSFEYTEDIRALYVDISKEFNEKWQSKIGIRLEDTQAKGVSKIINRTDKTNYTRLFPSAYISYTNNQDNIFNLSYSRRIDRPSFWELNPFKFYLNPNSYAQGNPYLRPSIDNNVELQYMYKNKYITDLFLSYIEDGSGQVSEINTSTNQQFYIYQNYYYGYIYGVKQTILFKPFSWWNTTNMLTAFSSNIEVKKGVNFISKMQKGLNFQVYSNQVFLLNKTGTIQAEITFAASSKIRDNVYEATPSAWLNLGFKVNLIDDKLQITTRLNDVFRSSRPDITTYTSGVKQVYNIYNDNRYFTLGINYKFGNKKIRVKKRESGNEDELNRI